MLSLKRQDDGVGLSAQADAVLGLPTVPIGIGGRL